MFTQCLLPSELKFFAVAPGLNPPPPEPPLVFSCSCPLLTNQQTLSVLRNGQGAEALFRIQMFKFVGGSYANVFLHCNVQICHNTVGPCQPVSELAQHSFLEPLVRGQFRQAVLSIGP